MTSLIDRIGSALNGIANYESAKHGKQLVERISAVVAQLDQQQMRADNVGATFSILRASSVDMDSPGSRKLTAIRTDLDRVADMTFQTASDDQALLDFLNSGDAHAPIERASQFIDRAVKMVGEAVSRRAAELRPDTSDEPIPPVGLSITSSIRLQNAQRILRDPRPLQLDVECSGLPEAVKECLEDIDRAVRTWTELFPEIEKTKRNLNPEVAAFVKAASADGAPFSLLTETVFIYLQDNELLNNFVIRQL